MNIYPTLTTADDELCKIIEPNVCVASRRFEVLQICKEAGIPTVVWIDPILPFINDTKENIEGILNYCVEAGVHGIICFGVGMTLREGNREYFYRQLDRHFPGLKQWYIRTYGNDYELPSHREKELLRLFYRLCDTYGIWYENDRIFRYLQKLIFLLRNLRIPFAVRQLLIRDFCLFSVSR